MSVKLAEVVADIKRTLTVLSDLWEDACFLMSLRPAGLGGEEKS